MLNRKICIRCCVRSHEGVGNNFWANSDYTRWSSGTVMCPAPVITSYRESVLMSSAIPLSVRRGIDELPPKWCPYAVEHVVSVAE